MGKLIVFEGTDGSGKSTQFTLLTKRLARENVDFRKLQFPQYLEPSSALIRMYLNGEFGDRPADVNPYAASTFYAVDRYASYQKVWKTYYAQGGVMLSDRYTTSNAVHQGGKVTGAARQAFFKWLYDFEYTRMGLPQPDLVICLDMPTEQAMELMRKREQDMGTHADIHEREMVEQLPEYVCRGGSCVIDPYGHYATQPVWDEETIIYADLDMNLPAACKMEHDAVGHYARPDVLELIVNEK